MSEDHERSSEGPGVSVNGARGNHRRPGNRNQGPFSWQPPVYQVNEQGKVSGYLNRQVPNNWGRWGDDDQIGTANFITPESITEAARLIRQGVVISCALPLDRSGPVHPSRTPVVHLYSYSGTDMVAGSTFTHRSAGYQGADDYLFMPVQGSTQWDGLAHAGYDDCLYNGFWIGTVESYAGARRCSISELSETLVGRGVLLDLPRHLGVERLAPAFGISALLLDECATAHGVTVQRGDILLIRTGHIPWFYQLPDKREFWSSGAPGLAPDCVEWVHERQIAAVAMDNMGIEVEPFPPGQVYPLHLRLIRDLGLVLGEMWWLEDLAAACAEDGRYAFFLSAAPLRITSGAGSMINPVAIK